MPDRKKSRTFKAVEIALKSENPVHPQDSRSKKFFYCVGHACHRVFEALLMDTLASQVF